MWPFFKIIKKKQMKYKDFKKLITSNQGKFLADDSVGDYHIF